MRVLIIFILFLSFSAHAEKIKEFSLPQHGSEENIILKQEVKKKKVLLNFWASWCTSCAQEIPKLEALKQKFGNDVTFMAINAGEKANLVERFIKKYKFSYLILKDEDRLYSKSMGVDSLPVTIVVDEQMNIIYRDTVPPESL